MCLLHLRVLDSQEVPEIQAGDFMNTSWLEHKADRQEALLEGSRARRSHAFQLLRHRHCLCEPCILCAQQESPPFIQDRKMHNKKELLAELSKAWILNFAICCEISEILKESIV